MGKLKKKKLETSDCFAISQYHYQSLQTLSCFSPSKESAWCLRSNIPCPRLSLSSSQQCFGKQEAEKSNEGSLHQSEKHKAKHPLLSNKSVV